MIITRWVHQKTKHTYMILGFSVQEATLIPQVNYHRIDTVSGEAIGPIWNRPCEEFFDGRFAPETFSPSGL